MPVVSVAEETVDAVSQEVTLACDTEGATDGREPSAAKAHSGKCDGAGRPLTAEDEYIAGTDPTKSNSVFAAEITITNGLPRIRWSPDLNEEGTKAIRAYKIWGKESLDGDSVWEYPTNALHRFFKVTVEMP